MSTVIDYGSLSLSIFILYLQRLIPKSSIFIRFGNQIVIYALRIYIDNIFSMLLIDILLNGNILLKLNVGALEVFANQNIQRCQSLSPC